MVPEASGTPPVSIADTKPPAVLGRDSGVRVVERFATSPDQDGIAVRDGLQVP